MTKLHSLSSSDTSILTAHPSGEMGLWSLESVHQGRLSIDLAYQATLPLRMDGTVVTIFLLIRTVILCDISLEASCLVATLNLHMAFQYTLAKIHMVLPLMIGPFSRGLHCIAFRFTNTSKSIRCRAASDPLQRRLTNIFHASILVSNILMMRMNVTILGHCPFSARNCHPFLGHRPLT